MDGAGVADSHKNVLLQRCEIGDPPWEHYIPHALRHESVCVEEIFFEIQRWVKTLEVAGTVPLDAMTENKILRTRRRANWVGLDESKPVDRPFQRTRAKKRRRYRVLAELLDRDSASHCIQALRKLLDFTYRASPASSPKQERVLPNLSPARTFLQSPVLIVFSVCAGFAVVRMAMVPGDGDIFWQQWLGRVILASGHIPHALGTEVSSAVGAPWVAHEWLFSTAYAWLQAHGLGLLALAALMACTLGALAVCAWRSLDLGASVLATMLALIITLIAATPAIGFRVQVVTWLFTGLLLALLPHQRVRWLLLPLTLAWANVHASVVLAPMLIATYAAGRILDKRGDGKHLTLLAVASAALTAASPLGFALPTYALSTISSPAGPLTNEWKQPADAVLALALVFITAIALAPRARIGSGERLMALALFVMMAGARRHVPLFFIAAGPFAAAAFPLRSYVLVVGSRMGALLGAFVGVGAFVWIVLTVPAIGPLPSPLPTTATRFIASLPSARVFCNDFAWCGMLVGHARVRVFLDGRGDPFPPAVWADYKTIHLEPGWNRALARNRLDTVLLARSDALAPLIARSKSWVRVYRDATYDVYRRAPNYSENSSTRRLINSRISRRRSAD